MHFTNIPWKYWLQFILEANNIYRKVFSLIFNSKKMSEKMKLMLISMLSYWQICQIDWSSTRPVQNSAYTSDDVYTNGGGRSHLFFSLKCCSFNTQYLTLFLFVVIFFLHKRDIKSQIDLNASTEYSSVNEVLKKFPNVSQHFELNVTNSGKSVAYR